MNLFRKYNALNRSVEDAAVHGIDFMAMAEAAPYGIMVTDDVLSAPGPQVLYINSAFERLFGWKKEVIVGQTPRLLQGPLTDKRIFSSLAAVLQAGGTWSGETFNYRPDGSSFLMEWIIAPLRSGNGGPTRYFAIQRDVTARAKARQRLNDAIDAAAVADSAKLDFLAIVGHELRTPLNAVIGFADLMQMQAMGPLDPTYVEYARMIGEAGEALRGLVENVIDVTAGGPAASLDEAMVPLGALLSDVAAMLAPRAQDRGITINRVGDATVSGDARRLRQALIQIIGNAVTFNRQGGRVDVTVASAGPDVSVVVDDDGPGFPADAERLLAPFGQKDTSLARMNEGLGLGLAIARRHIGLHGATLTLGRAPGRGARVAITFPGARCQPQPSLA